MEVLTFRRKDGICPVVEFLKNADKKIRKKFYYQIAILKANKQYICEPHIKHFTIERYSELYEFRIKVAGHIVRIIFYEYDVNSIVLLHAFYKHDKKDTKHALDYALRILHEINASKDMMAEPLDYFCEVKQ